MPKKKKELDPVRFGTVGSPQTTAVSGTPAAVEHSRILGSGGPEMVPPQREKSCLNGQNIFKFLAECLHLSNALLTLSSYNASQMMR